MFKFIKKRLKFTELESYQINYFCTNPDFKTNSVCINSIFFSIVCVFCSGKMTSQTPTFSFYINGRRTDWLEHVGIFYTLQTSLWIYLPHSLFVAHGANKSLSTEHVVERLLRDRP